MSEILLNASHAADRLGVTRPTLETFEKLKDEQGEPLLTNRGVRGKPQYDVTQVDSLAARLAGERAKALARFGERAEVVFNGLEEIQQRTKRSAGLAPLVGELADLLRDGRIPLLRRAQAATYLREALSTWMDRDNLRGAGLTAKISEAVEACRELLVPHTNPLPTDEEEAWDLEEARRLAIASGHEVLAGRLASQQERKLAGPPPQLVRDAIRNQQQTVRDEMERALDLKRHMN